MTPHEQAAGIYRQLLALSPDDDEDELNDVYANLIADHGLDRPIVLLIGALVGTIHAELNQCDTGESLEYIARMADALAAHTPDDMNPPANPWWN